MKNIQISPLYCGRKIMLIEFTVGNFRSFQKPVTLSLVTAKRTARDPKIDLNNTFKIDENLSLLKSAAIYGANASGKSNLVAAMAFMRNFVVNSARETQAAEEIHVEPFRLNLENAQMPALFQIVCLIDDVKYRYGFEVNTKKVVSEWLFISGKKKDSNPVMREKESRLFTRNEEGIQRGATFREGKGVETKTRDNVLFLSALSQWNGPISQIVVKWFQTLGIVSGLDDLGYRLFSLNKFQNDFFRNEMVHFVQALDLGIEGIRSEVKDRSQIKLPPDMPTELRDFFSKTDQWILIRTQHKKYNDSGQVIGFEELDLEGNESHGTQKLFFLSGPLLDTLQNGKVLFVDELEARLHPLITCEIIRMFHSPESNPKNAQLAFTTHDTNLLSNKRFRRDQIWFTEKDRFGASDLYSLAELKVRNDASYEQDYIQGKYGAIPFLGGVKDILLEATD